MAAGGLAQGPMGMIGGLAGGLVKGAAGAALGEVVGEVGRVTGTLPYEIHQAIGRLVGPTAEVHPYGDLILPKAIWDLKSALNSLDYGAQTLAETTAGASPRLESNSEEAWRAHLQAHGEFREKVRVAKNALTAPLRDRIRTSLPSVNTEAEIEPLIEQVKQYDKELRLKIPTESLEEERITADLRDEFRKADFSARPSLINWFKKQPGYVEDTRPWRKTEKWPEWFKALDEAQKEVNRIRFSRQGSEGESATLQRALPAARALRAQWDEMKKVIKTGGTPGGIAGIVAMVKKMIEKGAETPVTDTVMEKINETLAPLSRPANSAMRSVGRTERAVGLRGKKKTGELPVPEEEVVRQRFE